MRITFRGAARTVTGSKHQIDVDGKSYLLDCGLFQGRRKESRELNSRFAFDPAKLEAVILSHAHIDHSGALPALVKRGFEGPIYTTPASADLCGKMLLDSGHIQEKDAEYLNRRRSRRRRIDPGFNSGAVEPLYTKDDAQRSLKQFKTVDYREPTAISDGLSYECYDAGHILGSSSVTLHHRKGSKTTRLVFSGDVGRRGLPIIRDPQNVPPADYLIMESTYGGRLHRRGQDVKDQLASVVRKTVERGGNIIVPAFAVGRTQQLVILLNELTQEKRIPEIPIFVDSPLATNATEIYRAHPECYDAEARTHLLDQRDPFAFGRLRYTRNVDESKALNDLDYPFVVISASGMCEAGRILHHLKAHLPDPRNTVLITGYQAEHTLGRKLLEGHREVPVFGRPVSVRADVKKLNELSAHADHDELLTWLEPVAPTLKKIFLVHGEVGPAEKLRDAIKERYKIDAYIPNVNETVKLD